MTGDHPLRPFANGTMWHITEHYEIPHAIDELFYFAPQPDITAKELRIARRCMNAFKQMREYELNELTPEQRPNSGLWEMAKHEFHGEFYRLIAADDLDGFARYMNNATRETLTYGMGLSKIVFDALIADEETVETITRLTTDRLLSAGEAMATSRLECPEQGDYGLAATRSATDMVDRIEDALGYSISRPPVMGNFGLLVNGGIMDVRAPEDAYTIWRAGIIRQSSGLKTTDESRLRFRRAA